MSNILIFYNLINVYVLNLSRFTLRRISEALMALIGCNSFQDKEERKKMMLKISTLIISFFIFPFNAFRGYLQRVHLDEIVMLRFQRKAFLYRQLSKQN